MKNNYCIIIMCPLPCSAAAVSETRVGVFFYFSPFVDVILFSCRRSHFLKSVSPRNVVCLSYGTSSRISHLKQTYSSTMRGGLEASLSPVWRLSISRSHCLQSFLVDPCLLVSVIVTERENTCCNKCTNFPIQLAINIFNFYNI